MPPLHTHEAWYFNADLCPADKDFTEWLEDSGYRNSSIFHFGTGGHHFVGQWALESGLGNSVLGITASEKEYIDYMELIKESPKLASNYAVIFSDIYLLDVRNLSDFDVISMFHLGEFAPSEESDYGGCSNLELIRRFLRRLKHSGRMIFYNRSAGYGRIEKDLQLLVDSGEFVYQSLYKTMVVYGRG